MFGVIPDSSGVVYIADQTTDEVFELFQTLFPGVNSQLNPSYVGTQKDVVDFVLLPNSSGVVYKADQNTEGVNEIYRVVPSWFNQAQSCTGPWTKRLDLRRGSR